MNLEYLVVVPSVLVMDEMASCPEGEMVFAEVVAVVNDRNDAVAWLEFDPLLN